MCWRRVLVPASGVLIGALYRVTREEPTLPSAWSCDTLYADSYCGQHQGAVDVASPGDGLVEPPIRVSGRGVSEDCSVVKSTTCKRRCANDSIWSLCG